jgi:hypothetical protein
MRARAAAAGGVPCGVDAYSLRGRRTLQRLGCRARTWLSQAYRFETGSMRTHAPPGRCSSTSSMNTSWHCRGTAVLLLAAQLHCQAAAWSTSKSHRPNDALLGQVNVPVEPCPCVHISKTFGALHCWECALASHLYARGLFQKMRLSPSALAVFSETEADGTG